jgi:hypothetical protein
VLGHGEEAAAADTVRPDPVVLSGASLPKLTGIGAADLVAFRFRDPKHGKGRWKQVPVQLDERKLVDFGSAPPNNATPGSEGTVYGTAPIGQAVLQYADPQTFVGADPVAGLDGDDEVALIGSDAGEKASKHVERPKHTRGSRTSIKLTDPLGGPKGFLYLFRSKGGLDPTAGRDYVRYQFELTSGDYKATYRRADGPNPETSTVTTDAYTIGFSDRWYYDALAIRAGGATNVDILDGFKFSFGPTSCARSEATFNDAEGAFVANLDGPVRAIRAYVGANSGPLTERTNIFYPDRHLIVTDLRVHPVPGPLTYHDLSAAGLGMTYSDSVNPAGVTVDGNPESLTDGVPSWRLWTGAQGSLVSADRVEGSFAAELLASGHDWYLDDSTPAPNLQCWGDAQAYGQAGIQSTYSMPNTDPRSTPTATLHETTTDLLAGPGLGAAAAAGLAQGLDSPLQVSVGG